MKYEIKALLIDMDGTLLDSEIIPKYAWLKTCEHFGFSFNESIFNQLIGATRKSAQPLISQMIPEDFEQEKVKQYQQQVFQDYIKTYGISLKKGAKELLEFAKMKQIHTIVVTSTYNDFAIKKLKIAGIYDDIEMIVSGDMVEHGKPAPDIYLKAMQLANLKNDECLVIEDSLNGILSGLKANCSVVLIPDLIDIDEEIKKRCVLCATSLLDVMRYL